MNDIAQLTEITVPISQESPCGIDLRVESDSDEIRSQIRDHHRSAIRSEKNLLETTGSSRSEEILREWIQVRDLTIKTFIEKSKDLELAAYLLESLVRTDGYAGLHEGLNAIKQLIDEYWLDIHPLAEEAKELSNKEEIDTTETAGDEYQVIEKRIVKLKIINESMKTSVMDVPLDEGNQYSYRDYDIAIETERLNGNVQDAENAGFGHTANDIENAIERSQIAHLQKLAEDAQKCSEEFSNLQSSIMKFGNFDISFFDLQANLNKVSGYLTNLVDENSLEGESTDPSSNANGQLESGSNSPSSADQRDLHLQNIERAAKYFERMEPHSPLGPSLRRNLRWATMTVSELWKELGIANDSFRLSGVQEPNVSENNY